MFSDEKKKNEGKQTFLKETETIRRTRSKRTRNEEESICKILFGEKYKKKSIYEQIRIVKEEQKKWKIMKSCIEK